MTPENSYEFQHANGRTYTMCVACRQINSDVASAKRKQERLDAFRRKHGYSTE